MTSSWHHKGLFSRATDYIMRLLVECPFKARMWDCRLVNEKGWNVVLGHKRFLIKIRSEVRGQLQREEVWIIIFLTFRLSCKCGQKICYTGYFSCYYISRCCWLVVLILANTHTHTCWYFATQQSLSLCVALPLFPLSLFPLQYTAPCQCTLTLTNTLLSVCVQQSLTSGHASFL